MGEAQDANNNSAQKEDTALGKIDPVEIEANSPDIKTSTVDEIPVDRKIEVTFTT